MSGYTAIDLSRLPAPDIIETLDAEAIIAAIKADVLTRAPELAAVLVLESEPVVKLIEAVAFRELLLRARINDAAKAVFLATATGADLEHLAALLGTARLLISPANTSVIPPIAAVYETDAALRRRTQLALEALSTAGPRGGYIYHGLTADPRIIDVVVASPASGTVQVTVLTNEGTGTASPEIIGAVEVALNADNVRPLCDNVVVQSATILDYTVVATLEFFEGPDPSVALSAAQTALAAYVAQTHAIGLPVRLSGIYAALHQPGVAHVILTQPLADVVPTNVQAPRCTLMTVSAA